jgi:hypothetical protein
MVNYVLNHEHVFISVLFFYIKLMGEGLCEMIIFNSHMVWNNWILKFVDNHINYHFGLSQQHLSQLSIFPSFGFNIYIICIKVGLKYSP